MRPADLRGFGPVGTNGSSEPVALAGVARSASAARSTIGALMDDYHYALAAGRVDAWAKAMHAAVDYFACEPPRIHKRAEESP